MTTKCDFLKETGKGSCGVSSFVQDHFSGQTKAAAGLLGIGCSYGNNLILLQSFRFLFFPLTFHPLVFLSSKMF